MAYVYIINMILRADLFFSLRIVLKTSVYVTGNNFYLSFSCLLYIYICFSLIKYVLEVENNNIGNLNKEKIVFSRAHPNKLSHFIQDDKDNPEGKFP